MRRLSGISAFLSIAIAAACAADLPTRHSVDDEPLPYSSTSTTVEISDVRVASGRRYVAVNGGMSNGARVYIDRTYSYESVPTVLGGQSHIRTANGDQASTGDNSFLSFTIDRDAEVYVAYNGETPPAWLRNGFASTGQRLVVAKDRQKLTFHIYSRSFAAGRVVLGSNRESGGDAAMYTVIVAPASTVSAESPATASGFEAVVSGIRPRGYGQGTYARVQPASGSKMYYVATNGSDSNAGTSSAPFRTINKAAQVAVSGDVVTIRNGTYRESVLVKNGGTASKPIVFQAENRGGVVLTGGQYHFVPANWTGGVKQSGSIFVTIRGLVFREYAPITTQARYRAAVGAIRGWRIEDCLFDRAGYSGLDIRGDAVEVVRSTFQYHHTLGLAAIGSSSLPPLQNIKITDIVLRGNNTRSDPLHGTSSTKVVKFWYTKGTVVDNIESYENNGPGWWFDTGNTHYTIRNSYLHHNVSGSGRGVFLEKNSAPGLVENNVLTHNSVAGVAVVNSEGVTVRDNLFVNNHRSLFIVNMDRGSSYPVLKDLAIRGNYFKGWLQAAGTHSAGNAISTAAKMNITSDYNVYDPGSKSELTYWKETGHLRTLTELRNQLGWERNGRMESIKWPL